MRKVQLLLVCLVLSVAASAADKVVKLPKPNLNRAGTVMKALSERQSTRPESGKRTAPSALNKQDVDVYVILPAGSYVYDAKNHQLNLVSEGDHRDAVAGGQTFVKAAPVSLVLVSDVSLFGDAQKPQNQVVGAMDVGIVSQNISLFCANAKLATVPRGSMDATQLKKVLKLKDSQIPMLNHPVGYFK